MCDVCVDFLSLLVTCRSQIHFYNHEKKKTTEFLFFSVVSHAKQWKMCAKKCQTPAQAQFCMECGYRWSPSSDESVHCEYLLSLNTQKKNIPFSMCSLHRIELRWLTHLHAAGAPRSADAFSTRIHCTCR